MRIEELAAEALKRMGNDRYRLTVAVSTRADQLSKGAKTLLENTDTKNMKYSDIAIKEIAQGLFNPEIEQA